MNDVDENLLSRYLDGTLGYQRTCEMADQIASDSIIRDKMLELLRSHALLKSFAHETVSERVPDRLLLTIRNGKKRRWRVPAANRSFLQIAAALVLLLAGFATGRVGDFGMETATSPFPVIPAALSETVNSTLENEKSGAVRTWSDRTGGISATVTPVKSYRDVKGSFFRLYHVDIDLDGDHQQLAAVAYRAGKGRWQTQSVFARGIVQNL